MAHVTSRAFNQDVSAAKRAASKGPVIITDRGEPSHVLLSIREYERLTADRRSIVDLLCVEDEVELPTAPLDLSLSSPEW